MNENPFFFIKRTELLDAKIGVFFIGILEKNQAR